jgi:segregation and condensation protein B
MNFDDDRDSPFDVAPDDGGLSLENLSQAFADLHRQGEDPYEDTVADEEAGEFEGATAASEGGDEEDALPPAEDTSVVTPRSILEAMLFVGHPENRALSAERTAASMRGVRPEEIDAWVAELNDEYEKLNCPYAIVASAEGYRMVLRPDLGDLRERFHGRLKEVRLSQAAVDIMAIVAYRQPIDRESIDRLRGKPSGALLNQLIRRNLLALDRAAGAKPAYRTAERFLELFGLESLRDLPQSVDFDRE